MKCTNCGRELSDDARFCEMCGKPVGGDKTTFIDSKAEVDPHYDLSVFSDDSAPVPASQHSPEPVEDDSAKTVLLSDQNEPTAERNRFEENLAMHRRYREERRRADADRTTDAPRRPGDDRDFRDEYRGYAPVGQPNTPDRYGSESRQGYNDERTLYEPDRRPRYYDDERPRPHSNQRHGRYKEAPKKNHKKTALIISIIALVLVIAILAGVIFFVNRNHVSAAELKDAKEKYLPPSQAVTIDITQKDPSNDDITFKYDDRARIVSCTYQANNKPYEQHYSYHDPERTVDIATTYREQPIHTQSISYDNIKTPNEFKDVGGYIVRLDEESLSFGATLPATEPSTEAPTTAPTDARMITDAQPDEALEKFLTKFVSCYAYKVGEFEYDYANRQGANPNILEKVCQQFTIADWELYSSGGRVQGWYHDNSNTTGLSPADAPWMDESKVNGAMGVVANSCDTADWICTNIFNINSDNLPALYEQGLAEQKLWKSEVSIGTSYCALIYGKGSIGFKVNVRDIKTDGRFCYVTYDRCDPYSGDVVETLYAVMEKKTIDGGEYWSMYTNTGNVPDTITLFTPEG